MKRTLLAAAAVIGLATPLAAQDFYGLAMLGYSDQTSDTNPTGTNIATDPDFPFNWDSGDGMSGAIGIGYRVSPNIRLEGRLGLHQADSDQTQEGTGARAGETYQVLGDLDSTTITVEAFYDFHNSSKITPYVKAGVGYGWNKFSVGLGGNGVAGFEADDGTADGVFNGYDEVTTESFVWNVGFGAIVELAGNVDLFAEYQYISLGDAATTEDTVFGPLYGIDDAFAISDAAASEINIGIMVSF